MKHSNSTGIIIIVGVLAIAVMKAFDISFNLENIKIMGSVSVGVIIALLVFLSMQSKKTSNPEYYIEPEPEEENGYTHHLQNQQNQTNPQSYQHYQPTQEEDTRYQTNVYQQPSPVPPVVAPPVYTPVPDEDNRWS